MAHALPARGAFLLLALSGALLLFRLGTVPLLGPDEPRYARVAVEMHRAGEWVTPTLQGQPWLEKPALYYWLASAAFHLLGETETAARLPSVLAALLFVGSTALVGARIFGPAVGLHAGFILATSLLPFVYGRAAAMDMLLAATVTAATGLIGLRLLGIAGRLAVPAAFALIGLATLAKGPLGLLLPGLVAFAYVVATRDRTALRALVSPAGIALFLLVAGPWYVLILLDQGRHFVDVFLLNHNLARFTSAIHRHAGPVFYYLPLVVAGIFPWSGFVLPALVGVRPRASRADLFVLLWLALPFVLFSLAGSKLPGYVLPCLPPLALLMGRAVARLVAGAPAPFGAGGRAVALVGLVLGALLATTPVWVWRLPDPAWAQTAPFAAWALLTSFGFSRRVAADADGAVRMLRVGGAGALLLLSLAAPPILARHESGRDLFRPARGREVLVWGAWRTAWMAGYFYNDGRVREVAGLAEIYAATGEGPRLVLAGPSERRRLEAVRDLEVTSEAEGPRGHALLQVARRPGMMSGEGG